MGSTVRCLSFFLAPLLLAQVPTEERLDGALQAYWEAHGKGQFSEAAVRREEARRLILQAPPDAPQYIAWVQNVAQLYDSGGLSQLGRAVLEQALARTGPVQTARISREMLLNALAESWEQDRNLLKAVAYREEAIAEFEKQPPQGDATSPRALLAVSGRVHFYGARRSPGPIYDYQRLALLYRQLGRKQDVARLFEKIRSLVPEDANLLASLYEQQGDPDEAIAILRKQADRSDADPQQKSITLQHLAQIYQQQARYPEAMAAFTEAADMLAASDKPEMRNQALGARQNLAFALNQAGQTEAADQVFEQVVSDSAQQPDGMQFQLVSNYANHLASTKRGAQAEKLLTNYSTSHASGEPWEETNLLFAFANVARQSGDQSRANALQREAMEKQRLQQPAQPVQIAIQLELESAQSTANAGDFEEAFRLAVGALNAAPQAVDRDQVAWIIPNIANSLLSKTPVFAEQLHQRLISLLESWSPDTVGPLQNGYQGYARFLMQQQRFDELPGVIARYRDVLIGARSAGTGWMEDVLRLRIEAARAQNQPVMATAVAADLLALEEGLSGATSEPYLRALETAAETLELGGDNGRALPLRRQAVHIADLVFPAHDLQRGYIRINTAMAYARAQQFEEAEQLATEAVAVANGLRPPNSTLFDSHLEQIRQMKAAATRGAVPPDRSPDRAGPPGPAL